MRLQPEQQWSEIYFIAFMEQYFLYSGTDMILPVAFLTDLKTCAEEIGNAKIFCYYKLQTEKKKKTMEKYHKYFKRDWNIFMLCLA